MTATTTGPSDRELLVALRAGDDEAYAKLWQRHHPAALRAARQYDHSGEAEDIAAEAFARVLDAVRRGNGPTEAFRAYLLRAVVNAAQNAARTRRRAVVSDDPAVLDIPVQPGDPAIERLDKHYIAKAYEKLTPPQKEILWYVEVERTPYKEAAVLMGLSENAASAVAGRARSKLRREYLQFHIDGVEGDKPDCQAALDRMGGYVEGSVTLLQRKRIERHVKTCATCALALAELREVGASLRVIFGPIVLASIPAAVGYLALTAEESTKIAGIIAGSSGAAGGGAAGGGGAGVGGVPGGRTTARNAAVGAGVVVVAAALAAGAMTLTSDKQPPPKKEEGKLVAEPPAPAPAPKPPAPKPKPKPPPPKPKPKPKAPPPKAEPEPTKPKPVPETQPPRKPAPRPEPPRPRPKPPPKPTPPSPTPPSPTPPRPKPPPPEPGPLEVKTRQLKGDAWEADPETDYVVFVIEGANPNESVRLGMGAPTLAELSKPTGTLPGSPPLHDDGTWKCSIVSAVARNSQTCTADADDEGRLTALVSITRTFSLTSSYQVWSVATDDDHEVDSSQVTVE